MCPAFYERDKPPVIEIGLTKDWTLAKLGTPELLSFYKKVIHYLGLTFIQHSDILPTRTHVTQ